MDVNFIYIGIQFEKNIVTRIERIKLIVTDFFIKQKNNLFSFTTYFQ